jgi:hypothetical protein
MNSDQDGKIKYVADLIDVREVALLGTADLAFWKDLLRKETLFPVERDGRAQLLIIAAELKYLGVRFRELSFSVLVSRRQGEAKEEGAYLTRAFNSFRPFAFAERVFFSTPYYYGDVRLDVGYPASVRLVEGGEVVFGAEMTAAPGREPARSGEDGWYGPVFLPGHGPNGKLFFAKLSGPTQTSPFVPSEDVITLKPSKNAPVLNWLVESNFAGHEWAVRADARHAKSKTYRRAEVFPEPPAG